MSDLHGKLSDCIGGILTFEARLEVVRHYRAFDNFLTNSLQSNELPIASNKVASFQVSLFGVNSNEEVSPP